MTPADTEETEESVSGVKGVPEELDPLDPAEPSCCCILWWTCSCIDVDTGTETGIALGTLVAMSGGGRAAWEDCGGRERAGLVRRKGVKKIGREGKRERGKEREREGERKGGREGRRE